MFQYPRGSVQWRILRGGRGSAKSQSFAKMSAIFGYNEKLRIACLRDFQNSIKESFYAEVKAAIKAEPFLDQNYDIGVDYIKGVNGTEYLFRGLRHNTESIKSLADIDIFIIEEAEQVGEQSWIDLIPTMRKEKAEGWVIYNPKKRNSACNIRFGEGNHPKDGYLSETINWYDNPFFPEILDRQRRNDKERMPDELYRHIWEGAFLERSQEQILASRVHIQEFSEPEDVEMYHATDFGFANDPLCSIECFESPEKDILYINREFSGLNVPVVETVSEIKKEIPRVSDSISYGDSARPEIVSHIQDQHTYMDSCYKWVGSIQDGINHLQQYKKIIIHPRCKLAAHEFMAYSWKVDRITGKILDEPLDKDNNSVDATRYALQDVILSPNAVFKRDDIIRIDDEKLKEIVSKEHRHFRFYSSFIAQGKRFFQLLTGINVVTKEVFILSEHLVCDSKRDDASRYVLAGIGAEFTRSSDITGLCMEDQTKEAENIWSQRRLRYTTFKDDVEVRNETLKLIIASKKLYISKKCIITFRQFLTYRTQKGKLVDERNEFIKCLGLAIQFSNYQTKGLVPVIIEDPTDKREIELIGKEYEDHEENMPYDDSWSETGGDF